MSIKKNNDFNVFMVQPEDAEAKKQKYFDERNPYADIDRDNAQFKSYYQVNKIKGKREREAYV